MDSHRRFAYLRRLAAIIEANAANLKSPTSMKYAVVVEVWRGSKRTLGTTQERKAAATNPT